MRNSPYNKIDFVKKKEDYSTNEQNLDTKCTLLLNNLIFSHLVRSMCAGKV